MPKIFISYRRGDSIDATGRIDDRLSEHFGREEVFRDVDSIPPGDEFSERIQNALDNCEVLLAIIGENWLNASFEDGRRRLDDEHDYVRREIETALAQGKAVIPVLVRWGTLPKKEELPDSLQPLLDRNATELRSDRDFSSHVERLVRDLEERIGPSWFDELTAYARQRIAEEASKWLAEECDPFVLPALARRDMTRNEADPWKQISDDELRALVLGQLPHDQNRVRIFSQSGTGKTTLLHYCEQQIAEDDAGLVPVRVSALSSYDWRGDVPAALVNRVLHTFLPADTEEATRIEWLRKLIREHRVVFLCDAVDQTDDQLAGFGQFLQSVDICDCPVILTGRPEVEQTRASVFQQAHWDTLRVQPFDEDRIRNYLGDLSDHLIPLEEEYVGSPEYERKQQWADLLEVPLLLKLMRQLAAAETESSSHVSLSDLHSRHAIYREAVRHLVEQGWKSLSHTDHREDLLDYAEVNDHLSEMAWEMASQDNFTSVFHGEGFRSWRARHRDAIRALEQVDLTTRYSLLDRPGELGLAWRHLSFCEYFAGTRLSRLEREHQTAVVQRYGRTPSWQWVFRFALSELEAEGQSTACAELARDLIRFGNPFLVFDAVSGDRLKLPEQLDTACRWLVHRDCGEKDYRDAWESDRESPDVNNNLLNILQTLFDRRYRDSRCLHPAWELLQSSSDPQAAEIRNKFLAEFGELAAGSGATRTAARSLSVEEHFRQCPPAGQEGQSFQIGEDAERSVKIEPFYLGKAPVSNLQFELFDPPHEHWRNQYSPDNDSPALYVNWYMAVMFCTWLGEGHRLPTEEEWEVACRAGTTKLYWWGDEFDSKKCNAANNVGRTTPADPAHANDWGFMDMCGNVDEWCADGHDYGRVLRGGSWYFKADYCRCSSRNDYFPNYRLVNFGFRLARTYP